ncbi:MAG: universal stress protein, partial [Alphaproteobacteria bacterium]|nr:universal stress protein [Alphaproteobacteria bacterium]
HVVSASALEELRRWLRDRGDAEAALLAEARDQLTSLGADLRSRLGISVVERMAVQRAIDAIAQEAEERNADLIVVGTRGAGFLRGLVVGSTAERVARRALRPVLLVRQTPHEAYRRVLVPIDFSPWSAGAIDVARRVAPGAALVLMHAVEVPFEHKLRFAGVTERIIAELKASARSDAQAALRALASRCGLAAHQFEIETPDGADPWMRIAQQEQEQDCDLIVVGKHGRHAAEELILGTTTRMVVLECTADVLISTRSDG